MKNFILSLLTLFSAQTCFIGLPVFADSANSKEIINLADIDLDQKIYKDYQSLFQGLVIPTKSSSSHSPLAFSWFKNPILTTTVKYDACIKLLHSSAFTLKIKNTTDAILLAVVLNYESFAKGYYSAKDQVFCQSNQQNEKPLTFNLSHTLRDAKISPDEFYKKQIILINPVDSDFVINHSNLEWLQENQ